MASFLDFAETCQALSQTGSRLQIVELASDLLSRLAVDEAACAARFMVGRPSPQGAPKKLQVSGRAIWRIVNQISGEAQPDEEIFASAADFGEAIEILMRSAGGQREPTLTIAEVDRRFQEIAAIEGRNSRARKLDTLRELFARAIPLEGKYLAKILIGEMRHGLSEGLMVDAIARMASRPIAEVRRAHMLESDLGRLVLELRCAATPTVEPTGAQADLSARPADAEPPGAVRPRPSIVKPLRPMLAAPASSIAEAFRILDGRLALELKLDGARVQIHCHAGAVHIFSRRMNEVTSSLPEVVEWMSRVGRDAIFDGEVVAINQQGHQLAFQQVMRRFGRQREIERLRVEQPMRLYLFDLISLDGGLLTDAAYVDRHAALQEIADAAQLAMPRRIVPDSLTQGEGFYARALAEGYEGVMAKALASRYTPGVRGRGWLKIKGVNTFDLVIVAADWGYGRRHGWLSNYHLAARDEQSGEFVEVGKTFKGLSDADFIEMTARLQALKIREAGGTVYVRPEVVVEVAYSDIQRSPRYIGGMALRFARIVGVRSDKRPDEADSIAAVAAAFDRQILKPAPRAEG
ncbi:MAG TPA: ATP-dependent DNA ligase [Candidatus Binataceae bacterium]|nr:ATP-dependent DNA ligase [Candidatus Binataceae bacterium]